MAASLATVCVSMMTAFVSTSYWDQIEFAPRQDDLFLPRVLDPQIAALLGRCEIA
jgi:hypothetical protein